MLAEQHHSYKKANVWKIKSQVKKNICNQLIFYYIKTGDQNSWNGYAYTKYSVTEWVYEWESTLRTNCVKVNKIFMFYKRMNCL